jgi:hypothetical protein
MRIVSCTTTAFENPLLGKAPEDTAACSLAIPTTATTDHRKGDRHSFELPGTRPANKMDLDGGDYQNIDYTLERTLPTPSVDNVKGPRDSADFISEDRLGCDYESIMASGDSSLASEGFTQ